MKAVDTNILVRLVLKDDPEQFRQAKAVVVAAHHRGERLFVPQVVLQELVWVIRNRFQADRAELVAMMDGLLTMPVWEVEESARVAAALRIMEEHPVDFTDACLTAISHEKGVDGVLSFDRDLGRIGARWQRP